MGLFESKGVFSQDLVNQYFKTFKDEDLEKIFKVTFYEEAILKAKEIDASREKGLKLGRLAGIPIIITDDISTKGFLTTAGSKMLENYIPPFDASIIERLEGEDAIILGKLRINEFNLKALEFPRDTSKFLPTIVGSQVNGHPVSIKPSYGLVSRYGVISATSSLDGIYISGKSMEDMGLILEIIGGYDENDSTSVNIQTSSYSKQSDFPKEEVKISIPKDLLGFKDSRLDEFINCLRETADLVEDISIENIKYSSLAYRILTSGEFASNTARYDGIGFGYRAGDYKDREDLYKRSRSESFGLEAKKTIIFGNYLIGSEGYDKYYRKSQQIRTLIKGQVDKILGQSEFILIPLINSMDKESKDNYKSLAALTGYPEIKIKFYIADKEEIQLLLISKSFKEKDLLQLGYILEEEILIKGENNG